MKNYIPMFDRILVKPDEEEQEGLIIVQKMAKDVPTTGTVVKVGQGKLLQSGELFKPMLQVGTRIVFSKYTGIEIEVDKGIKYRIMKEEDVLGYEEL